MAKRYTQPQSGPAQIDWANPITRGATVWSYLSPEKLYGATQLSGTESSSSGYSTVADGIGRGWNRSANAGVDFGTKQIIRSNATTVLVVAAPRSSTSRKAAFSQRLAGGSYTQVDVVFNSDTDGTASRAGAAQLITYNGGSSTVLAYSQTDGLPHSWVFSNSTTSGYIYRDGISQALAYNTRTTALYGSTQKLRIGNMADDATATYPHDDPLLLVVVFDRQLSRDEAASLSANPWQIFKGSTSVLASVGGGGPNTYTITPSGGILFSGTAYLARELVFTTSGSISFSGTNITTKVKVYAPTGTINFSGTATEYKTKVFVPSGTIVFSGTAPLINPNAVGTTSTWRTMTGAGF